jgi:hypothetical protein
MSTWWPSASGIKGEEETATGPCMTPVAHRTHTRCSTTTTHRMCTGARGRSGTACLCAPDGLHNAGEVTPDLTGPLCAFPPFAGSCVVGARAPAALVWGT